MFENENDIKCEDVKNSGAQLYCICRSSMINVFMIRCDFCEEWYHGECIGITEERSEIIDKFCCKPCKRKNPALRTTYKTLNKQRIIKTKSKGEKLFKSYKKILSSTTLNPNLMLENTTTPTIIASEKQTKKHFDFVDTTIRKAKTEAYRKFKSNPANKDGTNKMVKEKPTLKQCFEPGRIKESQKYPLKQCYGPGCTKASREGSKYCSDDCGITLAKHRILEILPQRIQQWNRTPSAADELNCKKLSEIRAKLHDIEKKLEELEIKISKLMKEISNCKNPANYFVELQCDDISTPMDCVLCGGEIPNKSIERHLEQCYLKLEKRVTTDDKIKPTDEKFNIFCNQRISKNSWCKKFKVLCPLHYEKYRKADEVCGYYLGKENGIDRYCGNKGRTCNHLNWEEIQKASLDLEKLNLLLKFNDLKDEEEKIRREMSRRGDIVSLMCNYTIEH